MPVNIISDLEDSAFEGQRVFIRVDFNVPLQEDGRITDDTRIRAALPTLRYALEHGASLVLASHLGRPKGKPLPKLSLRPAAERLSELLDIDVIFPDDCGGDGVEFLAREELSPGRVMLLENLRFHAEEKENEADFAGQLASLADTYVNDAFGTSHRAHASVVGITNHFPFARRAAGFLIQKELDFLKDALDRPKRPFVAVVGGAKVSDKIGVVTSLLKKTSAILVGGAMAYTFLKAQGIEVGGSLVEDDKLDGAREILDQARGSGSRLLLPTDHVVAAEMGSSETTVVEGGIPANLSGFDIGPATARSYASVVKEAKTVFWNGPMGVFERDAFEAGTLTIAKALADSGAISIVGGGDSVAALHKAGLTEKISHISTGGGASLELVEGKVLPAIAALDKHT